MNQLSGNPVFSLSEIELQFAALKYFAPNVSGLIILE